MYNERDIYIPPLCPVCAKERGAVMGSTTWGHDVPCCGEKCGLEMGAALKALYGSRRYQQAERRVAEGMRSLAEMREATIASFKPIT